MPLFRQEGRRDRAHRLGVWGKALGARRKSADLRGGAEAQLPFKPLELARAVGLRGITGALATSNRRGLAGEGSRRSTPPRLRRWVACVSACALQLECDKECPLSLRPSMSNRDAAFRDSPRSRGKDEPRQGQRPATSGGKLVSNRERVQRSAGVAAPQGVSAVVDSRPKPLGFRVSRCRLAGDEPAGLLAVPRFRHHLARGVAGRPSA